MTRASHFFLTPKAGEAVNHDRLTQVGRALQELGIQMIPAYSPQPRGRSERGFSTWQGRLVGRYNAVAVPLEPKQKTKAVELPPLRKATNYVASLSGLEKSRQKAA